MAKLLPAAVGLFAVGLVALIVIFAWSAASGGTPPAWLYVPAMLAPVGLALALFSVLRGARNR